jgi:hypothetical protein
MSASARRGTIRIVPVLLLLAAAVILAGVVGVAMGHGGEMAEFATDYLPPDLGTAADAVLLRPPSALWGYNVQVTDEALNRIAQVITERDVEIAVLRQQLAELQSATDSHPAFAATLLARSKMASARGSGTRRASTPETGSRGASTPETGGRGASSREAGTPGTSIWETRSGPAGSPGAPIAAAGPQNPASPEQEAPGGDVPRNTAAGTPFRGSGFPGSGVPRSGEAAAGRDD